MRKLPVVVSILKPCLFLSRKPEARVMRKCEGLGTKNKLIQLPLYKYTQITSLYVLFVVYKRTVMARTLLL